MPLREFTVPFRKEGQQAQLLRVLVPDLPDVRRQIQWCDGVFDVHSSNEYLDFNGLYVSL